MALPNPNYRPGILPSAIDAIGYTPLISLSRFAKAEGLECNILAKVEFFSAGGSIKDRIAKRMIEKAEEEGRLIPGKSVIIEPTSGNTGIGLALVAAIKGYRCIITLPQKMSLEKEALLKSLGAEVVRTPTEAAWDSEESHIGVAKRLEKEIEGGVILNQYSNPNNPDAHSQSTYEEIKYSLQTSHLPSTHITLLVAGAGTGGTITGLSRALRTDPAQGGKGLVVAVDPVGSILAGGKYLCDYQVEGIGYDFIPEVLDTSKECIDEWVKTTDVESFKRTHQIIRTEGLLIGGSSGSAIAGMMSFLQDTERGRAIAKDREANVVVILADGIRNYIGKEWFLHPPAVEELEHLTNGIHIA